MTMRSKHLQPRSGILLVSCGEYSQALAFHHSAVEYARQYARIVDYAAASDTEAALISGTDYEAATD